MGGNRRVQSLLASCLGFLRVHAGLTRTNLPHAFDGIVQLVNLKTDPCLLFESMVVVELASIHQGDIALAIARDDLFAACTNGLCQCRQVGADLVERDDVLRGSGDDLDLARRWTHQSPFEPI